MKKLEKIYNFVEIVEDIMSHIFLYIIGIGVPILFIIIGIALILIPETQKNPKWGIIIIGCIFILFGLYLLIIPIKLFLEFYIEKKYYSSSS